MNKTFFTSILFFNFLALFSITKLIPMVNINEIYEDPSHLVSPIPVPEKYLQEIPELLKSRIWTKSSNTNEE